MSKDKGAEAKPVGLALRLVSLFYSFDGMEVLLPLLAGLPGFHPSCPAESSQYSSEVFKSQAALKV